MYYKETYRLKYIDDSDFPAIKELLWKVFRKKSSVVALKQKYDAFGLNYVSTIAYQNEQPVAFYGAILQKFKKNDREIIVAQACDSSTLQSHQGKGLHYELAKLSYENMRKQNVSFVYAFLNENSFHSTKKLGWHTHLHMQRFHVKLNTFPIAKVLNKLGWKCFYSLFFHKKVSQEVIAKLTENHKNKFTQVFDTKFDTLKNYYTIEIEDCVFWIKIAGIIHVGKFYAPSAEALQKAIKKLKRKAFFLGITEFLFQVDPTSTIVSQLQTIETPKESWCVGYLPFDSEIDLKDFIFTYSDSDTF